MLEVVFVEKFLQCPFGEDLTQQPSGFRFGSNRFPFDSHQRHQPPLTGGISSVSPFGSNFFVNVFWPSVMFTAKKPCFIFELKRVSISSSRSWLIVSVSHSAKVSSPPAHMMRNFLTRMLVSPVGLHH